MFDKVWRRALNEVRSDLRLDKPIRIISSLVSPLAAAVLVWYFTKSFGWTGVAGIAVLLLLAFGYFIFKLIAVPLYMMVEMDAQRATVVSAIEAKAEEFRRRIELMTDPSLSADFDFSIYQYGASVGRVAYTPATTVKDNEVTFHELEETAAFDPKIAFLYKGNVMIALGIGSRTTLDLMSHNKLRRDVIRGMRCHDCGPLSALTIAP